MVNLTEYSRKLGNYEFTILVKNKIFRFISTKNGTRIIPISLWEKLK